MVKSCDKLKALGTRHSFNGIADDDSAQISLQNLKAMTLDADNRTVTIEAGVRYGDLAPYLDQHGWALHNLASLPHISVVGSRSTATHGSGNKNGNLATAVTGFEFVTANGDMVELSREKNSDRFEGAVVDLGAIGVVTKLTLKVQPTFQVSQTVYENLSFDQLEHNLEQIFASGYSVSLFTDWQHHRATQVWIKDRVQPGETPQSKPEFFGATRATRKLHPIAGVSAENTTEQMGVPGPWYERLPHFRMNFTPSRGNELQTEYFVPRERGYQAILAVEKLRDHITPHLFITEFRTIDADHLWMSMAYQRPSLAIHFTWKPEWAAVRQILPMIEEQLAPFDPRPHWAKLFTLDPARLQHQYVKFADYRRLVKDYDPNGKFRNEYLNHNIFT
jgi:xylitol oxidase